MELNQISPLKSFDMGPNQPIISKSACFSNTRGKYPAYNLA